MALSRPTDRRALLRKVTKIGTFVVMGGFGLARYYNKNFNDDSAPPLTNSLETQSESWRHALSDEKLSPSRHARCRMACRKIDLGEVKSILKRGQLIPKRSNPNDTPCPSYAIEGRGTDGHRLRIVLADCKKSTRIITTIDLDQDWPCSCD